MNDWRGLTDVATTASSWDCHQSMLWQSIFDDPSDSNLATSSTFVADREPFHFPGGGSGETSLRSAAGHPNLLLLLFVRFYSFLVLTEMEDERSWTWITYRVTQYYTELSPQQRMTHQMQAHMIYEIIHRAALIYGGGSVNQNYRRRDVAADSTSPSLLANSDSSFCNGQHLESFYYFIVPLRWCNNADFNEIQTKFNTVLQPDLDLLSMLTPQFLTTRQHIPKIFCIYVLLWMFRVSFKERCGMMNPHGKYGFDMSYDSKKYMERLIDIHAQPRFRGSHNYVHHLVIPLHTTAWWQQRELLILGMNTPWHGK